MTNKQLLIKKLLEIKKIDEWKNYEFCIKIGENDKKWRMGTYIFPFFKNGKDLIHTRFFKPIITINFLLENIKSKNYFIRKKNY